MKYLLLTSLLALSMTAKAKQYSENKELQSLIQFVLTNSFSMKSLGYDVEAKKASIKANQGRYYPELGVAGGGISESEGDIQSSAGVAYLYGSYNLYSGGKDQALIDQAKAQFEESKLHLDKEKGQLIAQVKKLYYKYQFYYQITKIYDKAMEYNLKNRKLVNQKRAAGLTSDADLIEFEVRQTLIQSNLANARLKMRTAELELLSLIGKPYPLRPDSSVEIFPIIELSQSLEDYQKALLSRNYQLQDAKHRLEVISLERKVSESEWLPQLNLTAKHGLLPLNSRIDRDLNEVTTRVLLEANWKLFSGNRGRYSVKEKEANTSMQEAVVLKTRAEIMAQAEIFFKRIKTESEIARLEGQQKKRMLEYYKFTVKEYRRGTKNSSDLAVATEQWINSLKRDLRHRYQLRLELIDYNRLAGGGASSL